MGERGYRCGRERDEGERQESEKRRKIGVGERKER